MIDNSTAIENLKLAIKHDSLFVVLPLIILAIILTCCIYCLFKGKRKVTSNEN